MPYSGDPNNLPNGWVICDGRRINDPEAKLYNGQNAPNLSGYFIRGKTSRESVGQIDGENTIAGHSHSVPSHNHEVGSHTHTFSTDKNRGGYYSATINYITLDRAIPNGDAFTNHSQTISYFENNTEYDGNHTHSCTTGNASTGYTGNGGGGQTGTSSPENNVPEYKAYYYIIKIK